MRRRRRSDAEVPNRERWLVSYSDFVTVLFGFFVFMYAMSAMDDDQSYAVSQHLQGLFSAPARSFDPIAIDEPLDPTEAEEHRDPGLMPLHDLDSAFDELVRELEDVAELEVRQGEEWMELTLPGALLFPSAQAVLQSEARAVLRRLVAVLAGSENAILVEGFTDNLPIRTEQFPSNWELSAARAAAVVRFLENEGIASQRLGAVGHGANHPVARNDTPRGREANRRVVLLVSADRAMPAMAPARE